MMIKSAVLLLLFLPFLAEAQWLYDPLVLYDEPKGLYDPDSIRSINIEFEESNFHQILVDSFLAKNLDFRLAATLQMNGVNYDNVGIRYKGGSSFHHPNNDQSLKLPYNIDMNEWIDGQKLMNYKKIKLANAWFDPSFVKGFAASNVYKNYLPSSEVNLMKLWAQGEYLGLYVNTEAINKQFLSKHFGEKDGVLFKCDGPPPNATGYLDPLLQWEGPDSLAYFNGYTLKSDYGWQQLVDLIQILNFQPEALGDILNIDRVLWAFAVNTVLLNLDTYNGYFAHNYYLYQTKDGLFQMIPWDFDNSFIGGFLGNNFWTPEVIYELNPFLGEDLGQAGILRPLTMVLFNNPLYRKQYIAHIRTIVDELLPQTWLKAKLERLQALAFEAASLDTNKAFDMFSYFSNLEEAYWSGSWGYGGIFSSLEGRITYLQTHPEIMASPPEIQELSISNSILRVEVAQANVVSLMATTSQYPSKFQAYPMYDDGTHFDEIAGDGIYSCALPFDGAFDLKFYCRAQNEEAMTLAPERAEYVYYNYSPQTSNDELSLTQDIRLYPNPSQNWIILEKESVQTEYFEIFDDFGRSVLKGKTQSDIQKIDLSSLPAGVYFFQLGELTKKILISR